MKTVAQTQTATLSWQAALADAITHPQELIEILGLDETRLAPATLAAQGFPLRVPRGFVARMEKRNPADPLLRQVLPLQDELAMAPDYVADPVGDLESIRIPGLLHKYSK